ncbi:MAG: 50S ribosomal protein L4 [Euryarchaeota archaeon]|nr:50S ribosomal protein L4 [Euryarchaeota archaeon]
MAEVNLYDAKGAAKGKVALPAVFETPFRPDLIRKAVQVARSNRRQAYGSHPMAGKRHSSESAGKGKGVSRVPRLKQGNAAALAPPNVGGRRAHPPESRRDWSEKINNKERKLAIASALAAAGRPELVKGRGHRVGDGVSLPIVVSDDFAGVDKTKDIIAALVSIGLGEDLDRARDGRHERAGIGKLRGRRLKTPKSLLFVTDETVPRGLLNIPGVDVVAARDLNTERLAPGGDAGRLLVITESALKRIGGGA